MNNSNQAPNESTRHPLPWRVELDREVDSSNIDGAFIIYNANDGIVINGGTYSHDGDEEVNMSQEDAVWLCETVNLKSKIGGFDHIKPAIKGEPLSSVQIYESNWPD